jgi:hypothetical protein
MENQIIDQIKAVLSPATIKITNETSRFDLFDPVRPYRLYFNGYHDIGSYLNSMDKLVFDFKAALAAMLKQECAMRALLELQIELLDFRVARHFDSCGTKLLRFCVLDEPEIEFNTEDAKKNY